MGQPDAREITNSIGYTRDDEGKCKSQYRDLGGVAAVVSADRLFYIRGSRRIGHFTAALRQRFHNADYRSLCSGGLRQRQIVGRPSCEGTKRRIAANKVA